LPGNFSATGLGLRTGQKCDIETWTFLPLVYSRTAIG
jgi:hypothetical protein